MKRMAILSVIAGMGLMSNNPYRLSSVLAYPVHVKYAASNPKATRNRKNTGSGVIKAKRLARKAKNRK